MKKKNLERGLTPEKDIFLRDEPRYDPRNDYTVSDKKIKAYDSNEDKIQDIDKRGPHREEIDDINKGFRATNYSKNRDADEKKPNNQDQTVYRPKEQYRSEAEGDGDYVTDQIGRAHV